MLYPTKSTKTIDLPPLGPHADKAGSESRRLELLAATANDLLRLSDPKDFLESVFQRLAAHCALEICICYWPDQGRLRLAFASGLAPEVQDRIRWLDFGQAVCGTVAVRQTPITAQHIQTDIQPMTNFVREMGMEAYCCHPLMAGGKLLGTLSFGTRTRAVFSESDVSLMQAVSGQTSAALERALMVDQLQKRNRELERLNADLRQFAYAIGHDLQEPVRTIALYSTMAQRSLAKKLSPTELQPLDFVAKGALRLGKLIAGLLSYTEASSSTPDSFHACDIARPLDDARLFCRALLAGVDAEIYVDLPAASVLIDENRISLVFQNLLTNAVKYRRPDVALRIEIFSDSDDGFLRIGVRDNGLGIAPEYQEKIFQLFKRLHGNEIPGVGIGLSTSRRVVEQHGGRLWVESTPGESSTFFLSLPLAPETPKPHPGAHAQQIQ